MAFNTLNLREAWNWGGLTFRELMVRTWRKVEENEILTRAAAVSFYAMLALVPMIGILLVILVQFLPDLTTATPAAQPGIGQSLVEKMQVTLRNGLPEEGYKVVADQIARMQKEPPFGLISVGLLVALWTSSSLFLAIIDAMNRVYGVPETRSFLRLRLTAIVMTLLQSAILLGALLAIVVGPEILQWLGFRGNSVFLGTALQVAVVAVMVLFSFALTFYVGPDAEQSWEWITPGSVFGTGLFLLSSYGFRLYVQYFANYNKTYGSLGGVMILLFWFWVSSVVLLTAGQMNKVIENASPVGKGAGEKQDKTQLPDLAAIPPVPLGERP